MNWTAIFQILSVVSDKFKEAMQDKVITVGEAIDLVKTVIYDLGLENESIIKL